MKKISYLLSVIVCCCMAACSGSDGGGEAPVISTLSVVIPVEGASVEVTLADLTTPIATLEPQDSWVSVTVLPYTTGVVKVKLDVTANVDTSERSTKVLITTTTGEKLEMDIIQSGQSVDIPDEPHDDVTDQPAYAHPR